jgi:hypothetical protein
MLLLIPRPSVQAYMAAGTVAGDSEGWGALGLGSTGRGREQQRQHMQDDGESLPDEFS